jgi:large subunit ribosomal protein L10
MSRRLKELVTKELSETLKDAKACVLVQYRGVNAQQMDTVRKSFARQKAKMQVVKNSLAALALEKIGMGGLKAHLDGPLAIVRGINDPATLAKTVRECTKGIQGIKVHAGFGEGQVFNADQVKALADIPSREVLYAQILGAINTPMTALACAFASIQRSLACALQAIKEKMEKEAPPPAPEAAAAEVKAEAAPAEQKPAAEAGAPASPAAPVTPAEQKPAAEAKPAEGGAPAAPAAEPPKPKLP